MMERADDIRRAEFPPAGFWRRWAADAPAAKLPADDDSETARTRAEIASAAARAGQSGSNEAPYRVMIVEDDPSQALFAESILNGAGMQAQVVPDPGLAIATLEVFQPDLVLMDLHMPSIDGTELTHMIRSHGAFAQTPIVFLTGDPDPERQFEVLELGADDFLTKPVRPRHLIAAVQNRIRRARQAQAPATEGRHPLTGLLTRNRMLQRLAAGIPGEGNGALFFVELEGIAALRDRIGYALLESVLVEASRHIAALSEGHAAARLNDNTFLVHADVAPDDLLAWARELRDGLARREFSAGEEAIRLRGRIGALSLADGFQDAGSALAAAEHALRLARLEPIGIARYVAPDVRSTDPSLGELVAHAIAEGRIELAYQPIVAVAGGDDPQYQTLLRLRGGDGTLHTAAEILPAAEAAGLLEEIDRHVLDLALSTLQAQRQRGRTLRLFVSQSPRSLGCDGYAPWLLAELGAREIDGAQLVVDVRQDDALVHAVSLQEFCAAVQNSGVHLCLSGYRVGAESDALLAQLPLTHVRLSAHYSTGSGDQLVRDEMRDAIERAHRSGLQVIGQQVENPQAAATLWMSGIDYIQGNLVQVAGREVDFDFQHSVL
ncbi:EAL domain-containing protein [Luteimonas sp. MHLX1A]|uniref:EAL domain-containing protein n=1 Tax=Alterluteimonas muca TaxID=2878684 RepID=UPI001E42F405|nr:EAL domain-containing protein [Luteimonas sp. MHLX1A]MCD9047879.1 EAL domain-containing protein [Luteimonas sp. MHLX1A]